MKERPILFSTPMVRALLEGRKTQTRRVVKPQPVESLAGMIEWKGGMFAPQTYVHDSTMLRHCPYGIPGERLWVRETWVQSGQGIWSTRNTHPDNGPIIYRADPMFDGMEKGDFGWSWFPSIYMPRWASRLTLEIVSVKVERLQDISEADAKEEGAGIVAESGEYEHWDGDPDEYRKLYRDLWESINGKGSWDTNPWVWCVEFRRLEQ